MSFMDSKVVLTRKKTVLEANTHDIAILSICVYIICYVVFEFTAISITALSSYSLYLCLGCCLLDCICKNRIRFHWTLGVLLLFGIMIWISCIYTPASSVYTDSRMYRYWTSLVLMFLIFCVKPDANDIVKMVNTFAIAGAALAMYIYIFYGLDVLVSSEMRLQNGDFGNVNVVGMHCAFSAMLAIFLMVALKKNKLYCSIIFVICLPCVLFSGSRKALLALVICLLAFVFSYMKSKRMITKILIAGLIFAGIVVIINVIPAFEPFKERMAGLLDMLGGDEATVEGDANRIMYLEVGFKSFLEKPIFGHGFCYSYHIFGTYSHNNYVELLMCHGIIGFIIYYSMIGKIAYDCYNSKIEHWLKVLVYIIIVKMLMEDVGSVTYYNRSNFVMLAILACCIQIRRPEFTTDSSIARKQI